MFMKLRDIPNNQNNYYGQKATWLRTLVDHDLEVVNTLVVTQELFQSFMLSNKLDKAFLKDLRKLIADEIGNVSRLFITISLFKENTGISDNLIVNNNLRDIQENIVDIYHSWNDSFARSHRVTYEIDEKDTYPTLLIQPCLKRVFSLVTRCPQQGLPTCHANLANVHNNISDFEQKHIAMLETIEAVLGFSAKVYFTRDLQICSIKTQLMSDYAYLVSLNDLLRKHYIDDLKFLSQIKPHFISKVTADNYSPVNTTNYVQLRGIPGSPGRAIGLLTFKYSSSKSVHNSLIRCFTIFRPDDVHNLQ